MDRILSSTFHFTYNVAVLTVKEHKDQGDCRRKSLFGIYCFRGIGVYHHHDRGNRSRCGVGAEAESLFPDPQTRKRGYTENGPSIYKIPNSTASDSTHSNKARLPNYFQTVPIAGEQVLKPISPWRAIHSKATTTGL